MRGEGGGIKIFQFFYPRGPFLNPSPSLQSLWPRLIVQMVHTNQAGIHRGPGGGGGVLPYMGYIGMCGAKGYGFSAVLVINRVSILAILPPFW